MYELPQFDFSKINKKILKVLRNKVFLATAGIVIVGCVIGFSLAASALYYFPSQTQAFLQYFTPAAEAPKTENQGPALYKSDISYEQAIIDAAKNVSPSVVSIVISKNLPVYEQQYINPFGDLGPGFDFQIPQYVQKGTQLQEVGAGSGFIVSADGLILTNKHVVSDSQAEYTVFTNDGEKYPAKVLALDPVQDLAVIKISRHSGTPSNDGAVFQPVTLGDSDGIQIGQSAIAIGNALGQFNNTVSVGVVSGLQRTISASDQLSGTSETLENIIQTDAAINSGNSGGPLLNLKGEVIGINTATAQGAQSIGFAIPVNVAKKDIDQVIKTNKIVYPFLGVRYVLIDASVKEKYNLSVDYGALVSKGANGEPAVTADSAAQKAGIKEKDVILEINGQKITKDNTLAKIIQKYNAGDKITLKILRNGVEQNIDVILGER
jgi:S1-C subfamily serine protease